MDTKTAKPNASVSEVPAMVYCISHEQMVEVVAGHMHETNDGGYCDFSGGYAYCPPPAQPEMPADDGDWAAQSPCFSDEETAQAELNEMGAW